MNYYNQNPYGNYPYNGWAPNNPISQVIPHYEIQHIMEDGEANRISMDPNSSLLVMHKTEPFVYAIASDQNGNKRWQKYRIELVSSSDDDEVSALKRQLAALEQKLSNITNQVIPQGGINNESYDAVLQSACNEYTAVPIQSSAPATSGQGQNGSRRK